MEQPVYKVTDVVGTSTSSIEDAIQRAIARTARTVHHIGWFEVKETRGHVVDGRVDHFQVALRIGFTLDE